MVGLDLALRFLFRFGFLQGFHLGFREHQSFLGDLSLSGFQTLFEGFPVMTQPH